MVDASAAAVGLVNYG